MDNTLEETWKQFCRKSHGVRVLVTSKGTVGKPCQRVAEALGNEWNSQGACSLPGFQAWLEQAPGERCRGELSQTHSWADEGISSLFLCL